MLFNKNRFVVLLIASLSFFAFAEEENHSEDEEIHKEDKHTEGEEKHTEGEEEHEDVAVLTDHEIEEFGIVVTPATGGIIVTEVKLNGEVAINEEKTTHISSRFGGVIKQVNVRQGQYVKRGTVVAVIENSSNLSKFKVTTDRSGVVVFKDAAVGENADAGQELFRVTDFSTVWVNLGVYQKDMQSISRGQSVIVVDPFSGIETAGKINYISPIMDEVSRTVAVRTTLANRDGKWKPGMFVTGAVAVDSSNVTLRLPLTAVHHFEGETVTFIQDEDGFEPREITRGIANEQFVEITSGLEVGDNFVSKNGFVIKSELEKSEMSSGHNH